MNFLLKKENKFNGKEVFDLDTLGVVSRCKCIRVCVDEPLQYDIGEDAIVVGVDASKTLVKRDENGTFLLPSNEKIDVYYYPQSYSVTTFAMNSPYPYIHYFSQSHVAGYKWEYAYFKSLKEQIENLPERLKSHVQNGTITLGEALKIVEYINKHQDLHGFVLSRKLETATLDLKHAGCYDEEEQKRFFEKYETVGEHIIEMSSGTFSEINGAIKKTLK